MTKVLRRGGVYRASYVFPHEAGEPGVEKVRPVLVLQNDEDNTDERYPIVLAAPITTQKVDRLYEQDVLLPRGEAGLDRESKVLLGLIRAFLKKDLADYVGQVSPEVMREVEIKLLRLLGLIKPRRRS
jgi:mRNA interferase MazF